MARIDLSQLDDFIKTFNEDVVDGQVPVWDGPNEEFIPGLPVALYLDGVFFDEELGNTTTSSTGYQSHHNVTTPTLLAGTYMIQWGFTWGVNDADEDTRIEVRARANGNDLYDVNFEECAKANGAYTCRFKSTSFQQFVLASDGTINFTLEVRRQGDSRPVRLFDSQVLIYRIA